MSGLLTVAALALPFLPFLFGYTPGESVAAGAWLGAASLVAPGAAGMLWGRGRGAARRVVQALAGVTLANVGAAVGLALVGLEPEPRTFAAVLGSITIAAGAVGRARGGRLPSAREHGALLAVAVVAFLVAAVAGVQIVPPLEDQDTEVQGTAYGLAHDLEPLCLTNRSTLYFFAHPLLLHALNASTLTLGGDLETVRPPYDAAVEAKKRFRPRGTILDRALRAWRGEAHHPDRSRIWHERVYEPFLATSALTGTRAPNWILAAAVAALLFAGARRFGAGPGDAALLVIVYATLPEIVVRSAYGGYYALTALVFLCMTRLAAGGAGGGRSGYASGVLAILANQKAVIPAAALGLVHAAKALAARAPRRIAPALPALAGMLVGGVVFWTYGLLLAPEEFVVDHLMDHGLRRFSGDEVTTREGAMVYASRFGIWREFVTNFGPIWCVLVLGGALTAARRLRGDDVNATERAILFAWLAIGALLFTATDWRQTKHLCLQVPAMTLLIAPLLAGAPRIRWLVRAGLALSVVGNAVWWFRLARDFESLTVTPVW